MPLLRYFVYVGGALLALLLVVSAALPALPQNETLASNGDRHAIRIHSERKLPARVVIDTTQPTITPTLPVMAAVSPPPPPGPAAKARESFAQLVQPDAKGSGTASKNADTRLRQTPKRKFARTQPFGAQPFGAQPFGAPPFGFGPPTMLAQQRHFGQFKTFW